MDRVWETKLLLLYHSQPWVPHLPLYDLSGAKGLGERPHNLYGLFVGGIHAYLGIMHLYSILTILWGLRSVIYSTHPN